MKITLVGGSGFVGTRLTKRLIKSGHKVKIADKNDSKMYSALRVYCDVRDQKTLEKELIESDVVINLAAEHRDDVTPKTLYDDVNVKGAENVCNACKKLDIHKIIFTSSVAVYGFAPKETNETGEINYFNDYGRTKWQAEEKYREWLKCDERNSLTILRPTAIFGEQNRGNIYNLFYQIAEGKFFMVGKGTNIKSIAYVENVAAFIEFCLDNSKGEHLFNYVDKPDYDMNHLVLEVNKCLGKDNDKIFHWPYWLGYFGGTCFDLFSKVTSKKLNISAIRVKKFCSNTMFNSENIKMTKFKQPVSVQEALKNTIQYEFVNKIQDHVFYTE